MNCLMCGLRLDPVLSPALVHPGCSPFDPVDGAEDPAAAILKNELIEIILWYGQQHPRQHQVNLGPSDISAICDRRIGYLMAGITPVNVYFDPWPAIVGTAIHSWLENAVTAYQEAHGLSRWTTEKSLELGDLIDAHSDLYDAQNATVIDHKTAGTDVMKKIKADGPPISYVTQVNLYGFAYENAGYPVKNVALVFYPRAGLLKNSYAWVRNYDRGIAERAIQRLDDIATKLIELDITSKPHRWDFVDALPSNDCGFCPMYQPGRSLEQGADSTGCPGRTE